MANSTHYLKLYYQRLITSTTGWTDEEFGAYLRLLIFQFDKGYIPNNKKEIARIITTANKNWKFLSKKFDENSEGFLINSVMDSVRKEAMEKIESNRDNGRLGGRPPKTENTTRFYLIRCFNDEENFYKPGITASSITRRYSSRAGGNRAMPYNFVVVLEFMCPLETALLIESELSQSCERYHPKILFGGHIESYKISEKVINIIKNRNPTLIVSVIKTETQTEPIPLNHIPLTNIHNTESNTGTRPIPSFENVEHAFVSVGGTKEMAKNFFDKYEATGWYMNGSRIVKWQSLVSKFIINWHEINKNRNVAGHSEKPVERYNFSKHGIPGRNESND